MKRYFMGVMAAAMVTASVAAAEDYHAAIDEMNEKFVAAYAAGDAAKVASYFTEDALILPPDTSEVRGPVEIEALWQSWLDAGIENIVITTQSVEGAGNMAYEVGEFSVDAPDGNGGMVKATGNFVVVWKKDADGGWKYHIDTWNDTPSE